MSWRRYLGAAALAGAGWSLLAFAFDYGVHDWWQSIVSIPPGFLGFVGALICGSLTGIAIAVVFCAAFRRTPALLFPLLPALTLPTSIAVFSVLVWLERRVLGTASGFTAREELFQILSTYGIYGLFSIFMPLLYAIALATQWWFRRILQPGLA